MTLFVCSYPVHVFIFVYRHLPRLKLSLGWVQTHVSRIDHFVNFYEEYGVCRIFLAHSPSLNCGFGYRTWRNHLKCNTDPGEPAGAFSHVNRESDFCKIDSFLHCELSGVLMNSRVKHQFVCAKIIGNCRWESRSHLWHEFIYSQWVVSTNIHREGIYCQGDFRYRVMQNSLLSYEHGSRGICTGHT